MEIMKQLMSRTIGFAAALTLIAFSSVTYFSCNKPDQGTTIDACRSVTCQNGGTCFKGMCTCKAGYEGEFCQTKSNQRYLGNWEISEEITGSNKSARIGTKQVYNINVSEQSASTTALNVKGFFGNSAYGDIEWKIGLAPGFIKVDNILVAADTLALPTNYVFKRNQAVANSYISIEKGDGYVNNLGTVLSGVVYISQPDSSGVIVDTLTFTGSYIQ